MSASFYPPLINSMWNSFSVVRETVLCKMTVKTFLPAATNPTLFFNIKGSITSPTTPLAIKYAKQISPGT